MGLKISEIIPKKEISWNDLEYKKIAVDASQMLYQFLSSIRQLDGTLLMDSKGNVTSHLMGIFTRVSNLISKNIQLCFVFDGKPPILKITEQEEREHRKRIAEKKLEKAQAEEDFESMYKYAKQTSRLSNKMILEAKELISAFGLPVIQAPSEAEAQAAFICEKKDVWAVASSDLDALLYGTPRLVTNLTLSQRRKLPSGSYVKITPQLITLQDTLKHLSINQDQLMVIAILVGTDYNKGIKGIGPKTALKLIKQHKDFNKLFKEVKADFNWKEIYAVFKSMPIMKNYQLKWQSLDKEKIKKILIDEHEFSEERVENILSKLETQKKSHNLNKFL